MIFSDPLFLFLFLPITFGLFQLCLRHGVGKKLIYFLVLSSFVFYSFWNVYLAALLLGSILLNFGVYTLMNKRIRLRRLYAGLGVALNISLLAYFKYANFFLDNVSAVLGFDFHPLSLLLPPGISFYTFQQITFLLDCYRRPQYKVKFDEYLAFVLFFPHLVAGPIVHHNEFFPQIRRVGSKINDDYIWAGTVIFVIGLFKKLVFADQLSNLVAPVFSAADKGQIITVLDSWIAAIGFTFQIYFDFSGYSDMAIGLALLFGIVLPINFNSPYKSLNITDFWRRWHITLSRFLKENIYIPLGGNAGSTLFSARNVFITMLLGGLWHGAGWTFVLWGCLHGVALAMHKFWLNQSRTLAPALGIVITLLFVVITWVLFRAQSLESAVLVYKGMAGLGGIALPDMLAKIICDGCITSQGLILDMGSYRYSFLVFPVLLFLCLRMPSSSQIIGLDLKSCERSMVSDEDVIKAPLIGKNIFAIFIVAVAFVFACLFANETAKFIYFDF